MKEYMLYNADCLDILKTVESKSIDFILCDLPYGVTASPEDKKLPLDLLWMQYERIIKDNGCIALFAQGVFYIELVSSKLKLFRYDLVWDKVLSSGFLNANRMPLRQHEQIAIFYKSPPLYNPQKKIGKPNNSKGKPKQNNNQNYGKYSFVDNCDKHGNVKYPTSIIRVPKPHPSCAYHRTEKPVELCEWLIKSYTRKGDIVLDNCMGAGSAGIAAVKSNRRFIGIELNADIYKVAKERIESVQLI